MNEGRKELNVEDFLSAEKKERVEEVLDEPALTYQEKKRLIKKRLSPNDVIAPVLVYGLLKYGVGGNDE